LLSPHLYRIFGNFVSSTETRKAERGRISTTTIHHAPEARFLAQQPNSAESPCILAAFVVNLEPHKGERPSVLVRVGLVIINIIEKTMSDATLVHSLGYSFWLHAWLAELKTHYFQREGNWF
jgi:hypothetical protein